MFKSTFIFILLYYGCSNLSFCQAKLKIGDVSPSINVTDYISNVPNDKDFKNKFIVLEFWATWCASCLDEVPKLNFLQEKFKEKQNLIFISISDEKTEKILRTLKRILFKSIVVSDQSGKTRKDFIEINDSFTLPQTILINEKGIIKWIGTPQQLNEKIINDFVNSNDINQSIETNIESTITPISSNETEENVSDLLYKSIFNNQLEFLFSTLNLSIKQSPVTLDVLKSDNYYFSLNKDFKTIFAELNNVSQFQIKFSQEKNKIFSFFYKNKKTKSERNEKEKIKENILNIINVKETVTYKMLDSYKIEIIDKSKLEISFDKEIKNTFNKEHLLLSVDIETLAKSISDSQNLSISNETKLVGNYDFILRKNNLENLIKDLNVYGLDLVKIKQKIKFFEYK